MTLIVILTISILLNIATIIGMVVVINRALQRESIYEQNEILYNAFNAELEQHLKNIMNEMHQIDLRGSFESDDEVGTVFKQMKAMIDSLEVFKLEKVEEDDA